MSEKQEYRNACITLHQPWASLLVHGIKRIEGRSWPAPVRGRVWIHAAAKVPEPETIQAMEHFYREIYAVDGVTDVVFPEFYPTSVLLGCVNVVGCVSLPELANWKSLPEGVRLEGQTQFCWLCEDPQKLVIPLEMRGWQGVYNLQRKIADAAPRGLRPVNSPTQMKFPMPVSLESSSERDGLESEETGQPQTKSLNPHLSPKLKASIQGAQAAANQFRR
ncbi:hypothetical protein BDL97_18G049600 [Sphagnum fallax]|nr:hypothetical protein BDL97_18G049600 [Sphagnum fallax]